MFQPGARSAWLETSASIAKIGYKIAELAVQADDVVKNSLPTRY